MNSHVKRTSLFLAIVTIYFIGVSDTQILKRLSNTNIGLTEKKQQKLTVNAYEASRQTNNHADLTSSSIEPYKNRWQRRFTNNNTRGYFFFKHIRKAGGTTLRGYFKDVFAYHGITHITRDDYPKIRKGWRAPPDVLYVEHEFQTMDTECANVDERWDRSLKVITLRVSYILPSVYHWKRLPFYIASYFLFTFKSTQSKDTCQNSSSAVTEPIFTSTGLNSTQMKLTRNNCLSS